VRGSAGNTIVINGKKNWYEQGKTPSDKPVGFPFER
jgi:hypothetical protein